MVVERNSLAVVLVVAADVLVDETLSATGALVDGDALATEEFVAPGDWAPVCTGAARATRATRRVGRRKADAGRSRFIFRRCSSAT
jgi:hypothetical protein